MIERRRGFNLQASVEIVAHDAKTSPRIHPVGNLRKYFEKKSSRCPSVPEGERLEDEFNYLDKKIFRSSNIYKREGRFESALLPENLMKNRYSNILPFEKTRIRLSDPALMQAGGPMATDFINANFISGEAIALPGVDFISTQAPLAATTYDFWRMVWEHKSNVIVMLCQCVEDKKERCHRYHPTIDEANRPLVMNDALMVECLGERFYEEQGVVRREFRLTNKLLQQQQQQVSTAVDASGQPSSTLAGGSASRDIVHFQYLEWPDHAVPASTAGVRFISHTVEELRMLGRLQGPIVAHCSAGVGRSGSFITIHSVLTHYKNFVAEGMPPSQFRFDLFSVVRYLRHCRISMVQVVEQYEFCYLAVIEGVEELGHKFDDFDDS